MGHRLLCFRAKGAEIQGFRVLGLVIEIGSSTRAQLSKALKRIFARANLGPLILKLQIQDVGRLLRVAGSCNLS